MHLPELDVFAPPMSHLQLKTSTFMICCRDSPAACVEIILLSLPWLRFHERPKNLHVCMMVQHVWGCEKSKVRTRIKVVSMIASWLIWVRRAVFTDHNYHNNVWEFALKWLRVISRNDWFMVNDGHQTFSLNNVDDCKISQIGCTLSFASRKHAKLAREQPPGPLQGP